MIDISDSQPEEDIIMNTDMFAPDPGNILESHKDSPVDSVSNTIILMAQSDPIFADHLTQIEMDLPRQPEGVNILSLLTNNHPEFTIQHLHQHPTVRHERL